MIALQAAFSGGAGSQVVDVLAVSRFHLIKSYADKRPLMDHAQPCNRHPHPLNRVQMVKDAAEV